MWPKRNPPSSLRVAHVSAGVTNLCEKYCERAAKRTEKAKESVGEALKVQTQREEELSEGKRRLEEPKLRPNQFCSHQSQGPTSCRICGVNVAQLEGDLRQSHRLATEKISTETSLKL